ncbi:2Fe-2S iron-sulfur cluster-binding protein [Methylocella silvestris]|uniref:2Fe-2S ferredoxin-type domain-containing protein n=1 Tax=Methylocella silvestris TaxID=199596 RepID=A0A2J7TIQ8_METSI|nr:2Fe-2S iron-sulfur cluster-binding protein [Methylocella silvestris]PNG26660.1 hypothetical protein CR492_06605 [Methylocella silvestris]
MEEPAIAPAEPEAPPATPVAVILCESGPSRRIEGFEGERLLDALLRAKAAVTPLCNGRACCGGCRIRIEKLWRDRVTPSGRGERSVLRYIDDPHEDDRLSCQIALSAEVEGLVVRMPERPPAPAQKGADAEELNAGK